jgi:hypothetical protein
MDIQVIAVSSARAAGPPARETVPVRLKGTMPQR